MSSTDTEAPFTHTMDWTPSQADVDTATQARGPWVYEGTDPALALFTASMQRFNMRFPPYSRILELGCAESDWLERMRRWDATFDLTGVDARRHVRQNTEPNIPIREGSAMDRHLFEPETFDWIVMLGALEHFGLGFYGDPVCETGDMDTMANVGYWLKPGGFVYFDVPCQPTFRIAENRHFRMYHGARVANRLIAPPLMELNRAYSLPEPHAGTWCHCPTVDLVPYWFVAILAHKVVS